MRPELGVTAVPEGCDGTLGADHTASACMALSQSAALSGHLENQVGGRVGCVWPVPEEPEKGRDREPG